MLPPAMTPAGPFLFTDTSTLGVIVVVTDAWLLFPLGSYVSDEVITVLAIAPDVPAWSVSENVADAPLGKDRMVQSSPALAEQTAPGPVSCV